MYSHYENTQVITASPERILIMLYEGAIRFSKLALDKIRKREPAGKGVFIGKALAIVGELRSTLDHKIGGEIARQLERLYLYLTDELTRANLTNSEEAMENVINILSHLRDTWVEAVDIARSEREAALQSGARLRAAG